MQDLDFLTEVLDLNTSKSYEYIISDLADVPKWATPITFQATFKTEQGREYAVRIFKDNKYGTHTRCVAIMLKSQTKWTSNVIIDPSTFKKVIVTMFKAYDEYKETAEGKMMSGFMLILQNGIASRVSLIVKALGRAFRSQPKKKLELYAATDEGKANSTWLCLVNTNSVYPFFNGKGFKEEWKTSALFKELAGKEDVAVHVPADYNLKTDAVPNAPSLDNKESEPLTVTQTNDLNPADFGSNSLDVKYLKIVKDVSNVIYNHTLPDNTIFAYKYEGQAFGDITLYGDLITPDGVEMEGYYVTLTTKDQIQHLGDYDYIITKGKYENNKVKDIAAEFKSATEIKQAAEEKIVINFDEAYRFVKVLFQTKDDKGNIIPAGSYARFAVNSLIEVAPSDKTFFIKGKYKLPGQEDQATLGIVGIELVIDYKSALEPITSDEYDSGPSSYEEQMKPKDIFFRMKKNSSSTSLLALQTAKLVAKFDSLKGRMDLISQYNLPEFATGYDAPVYIVEPLSKLGKYVVLLQSNEGEQYIQLTDSQAPKIPDAAPSAFVEPPATKDSPVSDLFGDSNFAQYVKSSNAEPIVDLNGVEINIKEFDFVSLGQKLNQLGKVFGDGIVGNSTVYKALENLTSKSTVLAKKLQKLIFDTGLYLQYGSKGVTDVKAYSGSSYEQINNYLRDPEKFIKNNSGSELKLRKEQVQGIDDAFRLYGIRMPKDMPVYRGASISNNDIDNLHNGKTHLMYSYTSASLKTDTGMSFYRAKTAAATVRLAQGGELGAIENSESTRSSMGNKIFFTIRRLDRCLSLYIADVSQVPSELELLINRGTEVEMSPGQTPILIHTSSDQLKTKCWAAKVQVKSGLYESAHGGVSFRTLLEQRTPEIKELFDMQDKLSLIQYKLQLVLDDIESEEVDSM